MTNEILFSIIIPVYNVESFLAETLHSVEHQAGDYFERSEVIIVDDGSTDGSFEIADEFRMHHPNNVFLIRQENSGVSTAKNIGISRARGKYVGFLDSDDLYERNTLRTVAHFFDSIAEDEADVVAFPMRFFDARTGEHRLNKKFAKGDRVIDVTDEWEDVQLSAASTFIRKSAIDELKLRFDPRVILGEDAKFITEAIMRKGRFGVTNATHYEYRKRPQGGSAIDGFQHNPKSYLPVLEYAWEHLFASQEVDGVIPKYVQNVACHDMEWRLKQTSQSVLSPEELEHYMERVVGILRRIDDDVILSQRFLGEIHMLYALRLKYGENPNTEGHYEGKDFMYRGSKLWTATRARFKYEVDALGYRDGVISMHGRYTGVATPELAFGAFVDGTFVPATIEPTPAYRRVMNHGTVVFEPVIARIEMPLDIGQRLSFGININGEYIDGIEIVFMNAARMSNFPRSYRVFGDRIVANAVGRDLHIQSASLFNHAKREVMHVRKMAWALLKGRTLSPSVPLYRLAAKVGKAIKRKQIWIVSDRPYAAGDNGEAFFRHLMANKPKGVKAYFSLKESSVDYAAMREVGPVIDHEEGLGKLLFLLADEVISSQADEVVLNAFGKDRQGVMDLYDFRFHFLQHGITKDDLSSWLNKYTKAITTFVTSSLYERDSIIEGDYGYTTDEVKLTGMPRFDRLENNPKKKIAIVPTWRLPLAGAVDPETGLREYSDRFAHSVFFQFYQGLMADERLNQALRAAGMTAELYLHPNHFANVADFEETDVFRVVQPPFDYRKVFAEALVLVTDYSSVAFDFAYLRKPVLYMQFDREEFFSSHSYKEGYYSYDDDGFGPVTRDFESSVSELLKLIESGGKISEVYAQRINRFFAFDDRNNSQRVLDVITGGDK